MTGYSVTVLKLAERCGVDAAFISELVELGVVTSEPPGEHVVLRVRRAARLHRDLGVNAAGAAVIVELLERMHELEDEIECFRRR